MRKSYFLSGMSFFFSLILIFTACSSTLKKGGEVKQEQSQLIVGNNNLQQYPDSKENSNVGSDVYTAKSSYFEPEIPKEIVNGGKILISKENYVGVPVLTYHSIGYEEGNPVRIPKEKFQEQMNYLKTNGYNTLSLDELYSWLENGSAVPEKPVVITFDDGYKDNYSDAFPILKSYGFKATVFVITDAVDKDTNYLTSQKLKEMNDNGFSVESHTVFHDKLDSMTKKQQTETLKNSKARLEKILGKEVKYFAYPYGVYNGETLKCLNEIGYKMAFTTNSGWVDKKPSLLLLPRVYIDSSFDMSVFKERISNPNYPILTGNTFNNKINNASKGNTSDKTVTGGVYKR